MWASDYPHGESTFPHSRDIVKRGFDKAHLDKIRIEETMMNSFEYSGEKQSLVASR